MFRSIQNYLSLIKFSHTIFALPFVLLALLLATNGLPNMNTFLWIILAMIGARSGAMGFNRLVDRKFDIQNPRTENRPSVNGMVNKSSMIIFIVLSYGLLVFSAFKLNSLAFYLSPVAIFLVSFYSITKRFTSYSHFFLGLAIGSSPIACWIAIHGNISISSLILGASLLCWIMGFDIIYSLMDKDFDKKIGLNSIPVRFGEKTSLRIALFLHVICIILWALLPRFSPLNSIFTVGVMISAILILIEHYYARKKTIQAMNIAFFNINALISITLLISSSLDILL